MKTAKEITDIQAHKREVCRNLGCSMEQLTRQYAANLVGIKQMLEKAKATGKKVNGYTAEQLEESVDLYTKLSS